MNANFWMAQQMHAASLGQLDRESDAAAVLTSIRRGDPKISRAAYSKRFPFREPIHVDRLEDGLIKAGWHD